MKKFGLLALSAIMLVACNATCDYEVDYNNNLMIAAIDDYTQTDKKDWYIASEIIDNVQESTTYIRNGALKMASNKKAGQLVITFNTPVIGGVIWCAGYNVKQPNITINEVAISVTNNITSTATSGEFKGYDWLFEESTNEIIINVPKSQQLFVADIAFRI